MSKGYRYLSLKVIAACERKRKACLTAGIIITVLFAFGIVSGIVHPEMDTHKFIIEYVVLMLPGLWLIWKSIEIGKNNDAARRYETIISGDEDGIVTMEELTGQTGKDEVKVFGELEKLFRKGYFEGCSLQRSNPPAIIINNAMQGESGAGFVTVQCPNCGGANRIRAGSRGQCRFCSAPIEDKGM